VKLTTLLNRHYSINSRLLITLRLAFYLHAKA